MHPFSVYSVPLLLKHGRVLLPLKGVREGIVSPPVCPLPTVETKTSQKVRVCELCMAEPCVQMMAGVIRRAKGNMFSLGAGPMKMLREMLKCPTKVVLEGTQ